LVANQVGDDADNGHNYCAKYGGLNCNVTSCAPSSSGGCTMGSNTVSTVSTLLFFGSAISCGMLVIFCLAVPYCKRIDFAKPYAWYVLGGQAIGQLLALIGSAMYLFTSHPLPPSLVPTAHAFLVAIFALSLISTFPCFIPPLGCNVVRCCLQFVKNLGQQDDPHERRARRRVVEEFHDEDCDGCKSCDDCDGCCQDDD